MKTYNNALVKLLRDLADYLEHHPTDGLAPILQQAEELVGERSAKRRAKSTAPAEANESNLHALSIQLFEAPSRREAEVLLLKEIPNRRLLESLARSLQLPVQRDDSVEKLRMKIIEHTVGSRLRSAAIQQ